MQQLQTLQKVASGFEPKQLELIPKAQMTLAAAYQPILFTRIELSNFYGIELDDFAHEVALLSLWLAQHQMNLKFKEAIGTGNPTLPLTDGGQITHGNATRISWEKVCPKKPNDEIYLLGNPPYKGSSGQEAEQKEDMSIVFDGIDGYKNLDYIASWFYKGANYIKNANAQYAFVSTNSICQGEQVALLWPHLFKENLEIGFAYTSFKWKNNAKDNAGVTVVIIGVRNSYSKSGKYLFTNNRVLHIQNINAYLANAKDIIVEKRLKPLSVLPQMEYGTKTVDGGFLTLTANEKIELVNKHNAAEKLILKFTGADEFINGIERYCLYIQAKDLETAKSFPEINERIEGVRLMRQKSKKKATRERAQFPYEFGEVRHKHSASTILLPRVSSERRKYIPFGFLNAEYLISDSAQVIYNAPYWVFGVISSNIHMTWIRAVCGSLETRIRYSSSLGYNTFPFPEINDEQKRMLERNVFAVLGEREKHSEKTLAQLYDPGNMPQGLRDAHRQLDYSVELCYRSKLFESDEERLEFLFKLYEQMIAEEKARNGELNFEPVTIKKKKAKYA